MPNCFKPEIYQVKTIKELNKVIKSSYNICHERHAILKAQAKRLNFKSPPSSAKSKATDSTASLSS